MFRSLPVSWQRRTSVALAVLGLLALGLTGGCRRSPNAVTADMQKQWEQGPSATPPPQAAEATRRAMQQGQQRQGR